MAFPSLPTPSWQFFEQKPARAQLMSPFEAGMSQSRPKHTSTRWIFTIGWQALGTTDYATLVAYYDANVGSSFSWTHPITSTVYTVRFGNENELPRAKAAGMVGGEFAWEISGIILEEV